MPGLIEGAHQNVGLGHEFLRHIERCKVLVLLLDMAGTDGREPWDDYKQLLKELELYDPALLEKPRLVVANKMDEAVAEKNLKQFKKKIKKVSLLPISAAFDQGMEKFKETIREAVEEASRLNFNRHLAFRQQKLAPTGDVSISKNRITVSPCLSIFTSVHGATISSVSRFVWPRTNLPPGASSFGKFGSSSSCCANEVERRFTFFSP